MATVKKRPAKIASKKKGMSDKVCPDCEGSMQIVRFVRQTAPSGMFWLCEKGHELPTR